MAVCVFRGEEPQITAYGRGSGDNLHANCMQIARKNYKAQPQFRTRMTRIGRIFTDTPNPRASASTVAPVDVAHTYGSRHTWRSASSAQSAFHHVCSSLKNPASGASVSVFIRVHQRFFKKVIFQTGYVFNHVHPVILSNLKYPLPTQWHNAKLMEGVE